MSLVNLAAGFDESRPISKSTKSLAHAQPRVSGPQLSVGPFGGASGVLAMFGAVTGVAVSFLTGMLISGSLNRLATDVGPRVARSRSGEGPR